MDKLVDEAETEAMDQLFLPDRIRIRLVLEDANGREFLLETQTELRVTEPLWY